jgi:hypothetical protein
MHVDFPVEHALKAIDTGPYSETFVSLLPGTSSKLVSILAKMNTIPNATLNPTLAPPVCSSEEALGPVSPTDAVTAFVQSTQ